ncbi:MAG: phage tail sheath subtilisin-like domain-containing protein [Ruminiclostridium sp.]|nr:phage tail sheath subtilisin-like domain-containing protein [Ruminiclostridium sp.]
MNAVTVHERPGVYSAYEVSSVLRSVDRNGTAALAAVSAGGTVGELYALTSYSQAVEAFGREDGMTLLAKLLLANGAARVLAVPVAEEGSYDEAFSLLAAQEGVKVMVCDSQDLTVQQALRETVEEASQLRRERIAVVAAGAGETVTQLLQRAKDLNSQRVVLTAPAAQGETLAGAQVAAAVAGAICAGSDPALPLGGAELRGIDRLEKVYTEGDLDLLIQGGVTPVEMTAGSAWVVRGVTTRTQTGGVSDATWRELTTILVVDDVIPAVRTALQARFHRTKNTQQVRSAIRSQVILELENKKGAEIINDYGEVEVQPLEEDPTGCLVTFGFQVAHGLNQIWLSAQITV